MPHKLPIRRSGGDFFAPYFWNPMRLASRWWDEDLLPAQRSMNRVFRDLMEGWPETGLAAAAPLVEDVCEDSKSFCLTLNVPGLEAGDIEISSEGGMLTVEAERSEKKNGAESHYSYSRSMTLPENAEINKAEATLSGGVLTIEIPKANGGDSRQKIAIRGREGEQRIGREKSEARESRAREKSESRAPQAHN